MKTFILLLNLLIAHFAFSNSSQNGKEQKKNLLENNLLKKSQPTQDLLEVVEEVENSEVSSVNEGKISLQLKKTIKSTPEPEIRQLAQTSEPEDLDPEKEIEEENIERKGNNLQSLLHESVFEKDRMRRDLDAYIEDRQALSLENEEIQEDFGDVEVRWKPPEDHN